MVPNTGACEYLVKAVANFMNGCGCGRAILKSDGEPAILALQESVKNARQSDAILENSPRQSIRRNNRERIESRRRNDTHVESVC